MVFGKLTGTAFALRFCAAVGHRLLDSIDLPTKNRLTPQKRPTLGRHSTLCSPPSRRSIEGGRATVSRCGTTSSIGGTWARGRLAVEERCRASPVLRYLWWRPAAAAAADAARLAGRLAGPARGEEGRVDLLVAREGRRGGLGRFLTSSF